MTNMFMTTSRSIVYGAKKLMDNDIFLVMMKNTVLLWLVQWVSVFWSVIFWLTKQQHKMTFKLKTDQTMATYLKLVSITFNPSKTTHVNDISRKWRKWFHTCVTLIAYIFCNGQWILLIFFFFFFFAHKSKRLQHFVQQTGIVRFFLLFEQYDVTILITSFWDTQYRPIVFKLCKYIFIH